MTLRRAVGEAAKGSAGNLTSRVGWRKLVPGSLVTRLYVGLVVLQTVVDMAIEGNLLIQFLALDTTGPLTTSSSASSLRLPVYLGIFAVAHLFMLVMSIDAVKARNTIQIFGLCIFNGMFLVYAIIQIDEIRQAFDGTDSDELSSSAASKIPVTLLTALIPSMIGACEIGYLILSWFCWREMGWDIYKSMGADRRLKKLFFHYQIFLCICKFSFFFFLGFSIQLIYLVLKRDWEFYLTVVALPFSLLLLLLGWLSARYEVRWGMGIFTGAMVVLAAYYSLKLYRIWEETETLLTIAKSLTVFAVLSLILLVLTFTYTVIVWRGFGLGLKEGREFLVSSLVSSLSVVFQLN
ncbi:hypothetical protein BDY24DRAFT_344272 [Mrakia frigida]|uniref:uncharacterized protein n=1 Tax=Mrakia frigida TaxID=29902 RepID=UPI003FCC074A